MRLVRKGRKALTKGFHEGGVCEIRPQYEANQKRVCVVGAGGRAGGRAAEEGATETVETQVGIVVVGKARASRNGAAWRSPSSTRRRILSLQCRF